MTTSIARQSVIIKCNRGCAYILGNYEFYYAAGVAGKLCGFDIPEDILPEDLAALLAEKLPRAKPEGAQVIHLVSILKEYTPEMRYDEQMKELLIWGKTENSLWQLSFS